MVNNLMAAPQHVRRVPTRQAVVRREPGKPRVAATPAADDLPCVLRGPRVGEINCHCAGKPAVYECRLECGDLSPLWTGANPGTPLPGMARLQSGDKSPHSKICLRHAAAKPYQEIVYLDGRRQPVTLEERRAIPVCAFCSHRQATWPRVSLGRAAIVTAYFNPQGSVNRRRNYERFLEHAAQQRLPVYTIEGYRDAPTLATVTGQSVHCADVLWHKERLLNLAIRRLPDDVDAVIWADADVLWTTAGIGPRILDALCDYPVIQPWSRFTMLGPDGRPQQVFRAGLQSTASAIATGKAATPDPRDSHPGFVWAARRETLDRIGGLYEHHITGGGDTAMALAFWGHFENRFLAVDRMSPAMASDWLAWARRAYAIVAGRVGYVDAEIQHLYHGDVRDREYAGRWSALAERGYDPQAHVTSDPDGALRWTPEAPEALRGWVADYLLHRRQEDRYVRGGP